MWLWPIGLLSSIFYIVVFLFSKLYAEMGLNVYYVIVSLYGWYHWLFWSRNRSKEDELPILFIQKKQIVIYTVSFTLSYVILFFILKNYTDSTVPGWDSLATSLSFIATWMLAKKILENWILWIVTDALCIGIYYYKHLHFTVVLFVIYTIMAIVGYLNWKKLMRVNPDDKF